MGELLETKGGRIMKVEKITFTVKRVQYQEIEVSGDKGFSMPESAKELIELNKEIESDPESFCLDEDWDGKEIRVYNIEFKEPDDG